MSSETSGLLVAAILLVGLVLALALPAFASGYRDDWPYWVHAPVAGVAFGLPAVLLLRQDRSSRIGWLLALVAVTFVVTDVAVAYAWLALVGQPGLVGGELALWLASSLWLPAYFLLPTVLLLVAPDGRLPGPRWRPVLWFSLAATAVVTVVNATAQYDPGSDADQAIPDQPTHLTNPAYVPGIQHWLGWTPALLAIAVALCLAGLVVRRRRATGRERRQLDVVMIGALATLLIGAAAFAVPSPGYLVVVAVALVPYPLALGVAAARHQLWDLDIVVRRSLVYGILTVATVAAYVVAIATLGGLLGRTTGAPLVATAVVAVGAAPFISRTQRLVDRWLYGDRADPGAAVRRLAHRWESAGRGQPTDLLPAMMGDVAAGLRAPHVRIVTATGVQAAWGVTQEPETRVALRHNGNVVGELVVGAREPGRPLTQRDRATLDEVAAYLAVVAHSLELSEDLQRSREQLVIAREEERRRLRRDLHDGLGPQLAAVALELETVRDLSAGPDTPAGALAESLRGQVRDIVKDVRRIVDDLRPPMLDDIGLRSALEQLGVRLSSPGLDIETQVPALPPLSAAVELAILRIAGEALTNVVRHSGAGSCRLTVRVADGLVELTVADDGRGFSPTPPGSGVGVRSMRERALELGGACSVESAPGAGTRVRALLPAGVR